MSLLRRRVTTAAAVALAGAVTLAGCGAIKDVVDDPADAPLTASCGVVIDGSGSSDPANGSGADAFVEDAVPRFLAESECGNVTFAPIDGVSQTSPCAQPQVDIDPETTGNVDVQALRVQRRQAAADHAALVLKCIRTDDRSVSGSDVLGGLSRIVRQRPADGSSMAVLVISDFINNNNGVNLQTTDLSTPEARTAVIETLTGDNLVPDLTGVHLSTAGFGALYGDPEHYQYFEAFWRELLFEHSHLAELKVNPFDVDMNPSPPTPTATT
jgi:hypothetical protein